MILRGWVQYPNYFWIQYHNILYQVTYVDIWHIYEILIYNGNVPTYIERYGKMHTKSNLMLFDAQCYGTYTELLLNNSPLKYVDCYKYLGHNINNKLDDESDMKSKIGLLYGRSNMLIRKFYFCSSSVKNRLFCTYCGNPYLCVLWVKFKKSVGKSVKVNNSFRILHNLNMRCSASEMFVLNNVRSYPEMCL